VVRTWLGGQLLAGRLVWSIVSGERGQVSEQRVALRTACRLFDCVSVVSVLCQC